MLLDPCICVLPKQLHSLCGQPTEQQCAVNFSFFFFCTKIVCSLAQVPRCLVVVKRILLNDLKKCGKGKKSKAAVVELGIPTDN